MMLGFLEVGISAFGGALPWLRRVVVERRAWLDEREFTEVLTICQAIPGPNVVNCAVFLGTRWHGSLGGALAFVSLLAAPLCVVLALVTAHQALGDVPAVRHGVNGLAIAATAYLTAMTLRMARPFARNTRAWALCAVAVALSLGAEWSMGWVLLSCGIVGVYAARRRWL